MKHYILLFFCLTITFCSLQAQHIWEYEAIPTNAKTLVFFDDFVDNHFNWNLQSSISAMQKIENSNFYLSSLSPAHGESSVRNVYILQQKNYEIETRIKLLRGDTEQNNGLIWGSSLNYEKFTFGISRNGYSINQNATSICERVPNMPSELIIPTEYNTLTVRKVGTNFYFFLNENLVHSMSFKYFLVNSIGFMTDVESSIAVDYLRITYLPDNPEQNLQPLAVIGQPNITATPIMAVAPPSPIPTPPPAAAPPTITSNIQTNKTTSTSPPELPPLVNKAKQKSVTYAPIQQSFNKNQPIVRSADTIVVASQFALELGNRKIPVKFGDRRVTMDRYIELDHRNVTINVWDEEYDDGDTISIFFNGKWILSNYRLQKNPLSFKLYIDPEADNYFLMYAHNEGQRPPNTAAVIINDGTVARRIILTSDLRNSEAIKLTLSDNAKP